MTTPSPFEIGREAGGGFLKGVRGRQETNAIDDILSRAAESKDPNAIDAAKQQIVSKVRDPKRQASAMQILDEKIAQMKQAKQGNIFQKVRAGTATDDEKRQLDPNLQLELAKLEDRPAAGGKTGQAVPPAIVKAMNEVIKENPDADPVTLQQRFNERGIPPIYSNNFIETSRRQQEFKSKESGEDKRLNRKETLPLKQDILERARAAKEGIRNKEGLVELIDTDKLDDPTFAVIAESLPFNLGKRMLSPETVVYKAGLVEEFVDLQKIFKGQTRTAELNILQQKLADTYLTDAQKKAILKSRIDVLKVDVIKGEAAAEVNPNLSLFDFNQAVEEKMKEKMEILSNKVIGDITAVFDAADRQKAVPLNSNDPESLELLKQFLNEADGNKEKAREIAKSKGYKVGRRNG